MAQSDLRTSVRMSSLLLCSALVMAAAGCSSAHKDAVMEEARADDEATIRRLDADWVKTAAAKDVDAWVGFYANDASVLPPNEKVMTDKAVIRKAIAELLSLPGLSLSWEPTKVEVAKSGDLAYLYGSYSLTMNDDKGKPMQDFGKNVEIWKKQPDGSWRCILDTWNSDLPAAPSAGSM